MPSLSEVPSSGFGYPLDGVKPCPSSEASFSSQRSGASPFKAFLLFGDRIPVSRHPLRSRAFLPNPSGPDTGASAVFRPPKKPYPLCSQRFRSGRGPGSPGPLSLSGSLLALPGKKASLFSSVPRVLSPRLPSQAAVLRTSGPWERARQRLPFQGAGLSGLSSACRMLSL